MEELALEKESDEASRRRLERLRAELADKQERLNALNARWDREKAGLNKVGELKKRIDDRHGQAERAQRDGDLETSARLMYGSAVEKLAYFLIDLAWRTRSDGRIQLPMSRYDIADYLGLSSETVSRTFTAFRARGLISTKGRQVRLLSDEILRLGEAHAIDGEPARWPTTLP